MVKKNTLEPLYFLQPAPPSPLQPLCFLKIAHYWQATAESDEDRGRLHEHFLQTTIKHSQMESFILTDQVEQFWVF